MQLPLTIPTGLSVSGGATIATIYPDMVPWTIDTVWLILLFFIGWALYVYGVVTHPKVPPRE